MQILKPTKIIFLLSFISIVGLVVLQLHNLQLFPVNRGFDALNHIEYINYLKVNKHIPLPNEGWELHQAPLYYLIASTLPTIMSVKLIGFIGYIILSLLTFFFTNKLLKNIFIALWASIIALSLPVIIYISLPISNEFFSAVMISAVLIWYVLKKKDKTLKSRIFLGALLGLSILSKATALILVFSIVVDMVMDYKSNIPKLLKALTPILIVTIVIGGWFYIRNTIIFQNPIVASVDFAKYHISQPPGYRDIQFFTDISGFFKFDLFKAHFYSLWAGTYFTWFFDGHNIVFPVQPFSKIGNLLVILSLPIFGLFLSGYIKALKNINSINRILLLYPLLLFLSYILYNFKLPFYSTVKGAFIVSSIVPFIYFLTYALEPLRKFYLLISFYLFVYSLLIIKAFWIIPGWYN